MALRFSLQPVLDVRHTKVEALEISLGELLASQQEGFQMLAAYQETQKVLYQEMVNSQQGEMDLFTLQHLQANARTIETRITQVKEALKILAGKIDEKRQELILAKQAEEVLKTLKENENKRYQAELAAAENRSLDDIYISQAYHNVG